MTGIILLVVPILYLLHWCFGYAEGKLPVTLGVVVGWYYLIGPAIRQSRVRLAREISEDTLPMVFLCGLKPFEVLGIVAPFNLIRFATYMGVVLPFWLLFCAGGASEILDILLLAAFLLMCHLTLHSLLVQGNLLVGGLLSFGSSFVVSALQWMCIQGAYEWFVYLSSDVHPASVGLFGPWLRVGPLFQTPFESRLVVMILIWGATVSLLCRQLDRQWRMEAAERRKREKKKQKKSSKSKGRGKRESSSLHQAIWVTRRPDPIKDQSTIAWLVYFFRGQGRPVVACLSVFLVIALSYGAFATVGFAIGPEAVIYGVAILLLVLEMTWWTNLSTALASPMVGLIPSGMWQAFLRTPAGSGANLRQDLLDHVGKRMLKVVFPLRMLFLVVLGAMCWLPSIPVEHARICLLLMLAWTALSGLLWKGRILYSFKVIEAAIHEQRSYLLRTTMELKFVALMVALAGLLHLTKVGGWWIFGWGAFAVIVMDRMSMGRIAKETVRDLKADGRV